MIEIDKMLFALKNVKVRYQYEEEDNIRFEGDWVVIVLNTKTNSYMPVNKFNLALCYAIIINRDKRLFAGDGIKLSSLKCETALIDQATNILLPFSTKDVILELSALSGVSYSRVKNKILRELGE